MGDMPQCPPCSTNMAIGGVDLVIHGDSTEPRADDDAYRPFLRQSEGNDYGRSVMHVTVSTETAPPRALPVVFESGGAWTMQAEDDGYRIGFHREGSSACYTVVCSDADTTRVRVYVYQDKAAQPSPVGPKPGFGLSRFGYPVDQLLLMNHLAKLGGVIVHSAGVVLGGKAIVFAGASGAGKSTIARLFMEAGLGDSLLSDDRVILRTTTERGNGPEVTAWGTPWHGDARVARNATAPLAALVFLVKSDVNELKRLSASAAAKKLMPVVTCPWYDAERLPHVLGACSQVVEQTPCYDLCFREDAGAVDLVTGFAWGKEEASL
jgi:hypothetical protein